MELQSIINAMSDEWQKERAETQMTLGKFIKKLKLMPAKMQIDELNNPHSYRGYYIDIAFEKTSDKKQ